MLGETIGRGDVRDRVPDGSTVAVGGTGLSRKPMSLLWSLVDAGVRDLTVVSFLGSVDVELLLAVDAVRELHTAGVSLEAAGLAPAYRAARQEGTVRVVEWSEGSLHAALEATARGVPSLPCGTSPISDVVGANPWLRVAPDPFTGEDVVVARALPVGVCLLHVPAADDQGNLFVDGDPGIDGTLARAASTVLASCEERRTDPPRRAAISRIWVDAVLDVPDGSWPTGCHATSGDDPSAVRRWARAEERVPELLRPESA